MSKQGKLGVRSVMVAAVLTGTVGLAACGSSSTNSTGTTTTSPPASNTGTTASSGSTTGGASANVTAATKALTAYSAAPTGISITTPLKTPAPKGKTLVWLQCALPQCEQIGVGVAAAAKAVGWNEKVINYDSANPATLVSGMTTALQYKPVAVINSGLPESVWSSVVPAYQKANVPIVTMDVGPETLPSPVIANIYGTEDINNQGKIIADWFISNSNGTGKALLIDVPSFPVLHDFAQAFKSSVAAGCSGCSISTVSATISQVEGGQLNGIITSALQKNPADKYLVVVDAAFIDTLPSSLAAAGLTGKVKIAGAWGDATTEADLRTGTMDAFTGFATEYQGWQAIDAILRHIEGMPLMNNSDGTLPDQLLTKATVQTPSDSYNYPTDYPQLFKKLWHVG